MSARVTRTSVVSVTGPAVSAGRGYLFVSAGAVCWGTGGAAGLLLSRYSGLEPLAVAAYRLLVGGTLVVLAIAAVSWVTGRRHGLPRGRSAWVRVGVVGALSALYQSCYFAAVAATSVSLATLVTLGGAPLMVVAAETVRRRRRPDAAVIVAMTLAVVGLALLVGRPADVPAGGGLAVGVVLALISAAGFATIALVSSRRPVPGLAAVPLTGFAFVFGGVLLTPVAAMTADLGFAVRTPTVALVVYLGLVPTALAYGLFFSGVRAVGAGPASLLALIEPITAAVIGAVVLGESLGVPGVVGGLLVATAVVLARPHPATISRRPGPRPERSEVSPEGRGS